MSSKKTVVTAHHIKFSDENNIAFITNKDGTCMVQVIIYGNGKVEIHTHDIYADKNNIDRYSSIGIEVDDSINIKTNLYAIEDELPNGVIINNKIVDWRIYYNDRINEMEE